jgi:hypothetical protein
VLGHPQGVVRHGVDPVLRQTGDPLTVALRGDAVAARPGVLRSLVGLALTHETQLRARRLRFTAGLTEHDRHEAGGGEGELGVTGAHRPLVGVVSGVEALVITVVCGLRQGGDGGEFRVALGDGGAVGIVEDEDS